MVAVERAEPSEQAVCIKVEVKVQLNCQQQIVTKQKRKISAKKQGSCVFYHPPAHNGTSNS
jgi:hypothetical protein